jgi:hypothetical protein
MSYLAPAPFAQLRLIRHPQVETLPKDNQVAVGSKQFLVTVHAREFYWGIQAE